MGNNHIVKSPFFMFCILCVVAISVVVLPTNSKIVFEDIYYSKNITYCFYTNENYAKNGVQVTDNGISKMIFCDYKDANKIKNSLNSIYGESICIKNVDKKDISNIYKKIKNTKVLQENFENMQVFYCYDTKLSKFVIVDGKKINTQIAVCSDSITIGYPIILGEY